MKFKSVLIAAALLAACSTVRAQSGITATGTLTLTNTSPPQAQSFFTSVEQYFTSFDTNSQTFSTNNGFQIWSGVQYQSGVNLGATFAIEAQPFSGAAHGLTLGGVATLSDVIGTVAQNEFDIGWSLRHYDVRITAGAAAVYTYQSNGLGEKGAAGGIYLEFEKALSANTFGGVRLKEQFGGGQHANQPFLYLFAGFVF